MKVNEDKERASSGSPLLAPDVFKILTQEDMRGWSVMQRDAYYWELTKQPDVYVDFRGQRFTGPFRCLCCGKETHVAQFAYGRCCGVCDSGTCRTNPQYAHAPYSSMDGDGHVTQLDRKTLLAPLSPEGDPDWLLRLKSAQK